MKNTSVILSIVLLLAACAPHPPLSSYTMQANDRVYGQIQKSFYLKNKLAISDFTYETSNQNMAHLYDNSKYAAQISLTKAGLMASNPNNAEYTLSAVIKDVGFPRCIFGTCETGSSIEYTLKHSKGDKIAYKQLLVVPYNYEYPAFGSNMEFVLCSAVGGAVGENLAHLMHVLTDKKKEDLK